jgi:hypothetical protein
MRELGSPCSSQISNSGYFIAFTLITQKVVKSCPFFITNVSVAVNRNLMVSVSRNFRGAGEISVTKIMFFFFLVVKKSKRQGSTLQYMGIKNKSFIHKLFYDKISLIKGIVSRKFAILSLVSLES